MARYTIDPDRSTVTIEASSSVHPIHSEVGGLEGWVEVEPDADGRIDLAADPSARLEFPVDLLRSGNPLEDRELRRRIDAKHFPTIVGELESLAPGEAVGSYEVTGALTFMGQTKRYVHDMTWTFEEDGALRLQGAAEFDVRDFGMEPPKILMLKVHPEVDVTIDVIAVRDA
jgi:polyisoprenoid-binding protein YceI